MERKDGLEKTMEEQNHSYGIGNTYVPGRKVQWFERLLSQYTAAYRP
jgi:hypothetical protein